MPGTGCCQLSFWFHRFDRRATATAQVVTHRYPWRLVNLVSSLIDFVKSDLPKLMRFAAVSVITVPLGMLLLWMFIDVAEWRPLVANIVAVTLSTIPNYLLNRYWVWNRRGPNSVAREIAPFWMMALLGALLSTLFIWVADRFTDATIVFLAANFCAFGIVWVLKFFVLEKYLFADSAMSGELS